MTPSFTTTAPTIGLGATHARPRRARLSARVIICSSNDLSFNDLLQMKNAPTVQPSGQRIGHTLNVTYRAKRRRKRHACCPGTTCPPSSPIRTLTVGTGISPIQPPETRSKISSLRRVAGFNRRSGISPGPEDIWNILGLTVRLQWTRVERIGVSTIQTCYYSMSFILSSEFTFRKYSSCLTGCLRLRS